MGRGFAMTGRGAVWIVSVGSMVWSCGCGASRRADIAPIDVGVYSRMWWPHVGVRGQVTGSLVGSVVRVADGFYVDLLFSGTEGEDVLAEASEAGLLIELSLRGRRPLLRVTNEMELAVAVDTPRRLAGEREWLARSPGDPERRRFWPLAEVLADGRHVAVVRVSVRAELEEGPIRVSVGDGRLEGVPRVQLAWSVVEEVKKVAGVTPLHGAN